MPLNYRGEKKIMMIRFVICVDVESEDLTTAYGKLFDGMKSSKLNWDSSDEWYDGGEDGYRGDPEVLQTAIDKFMAEGEVVQDQGIEPCATSL